MATEKKPAAAGTTAAPKKKGAKSPLRAEVERVAKATGLPSAYITKLVASEKKKLLDAHKAALAELAGRVQPIVAAALAAVAAPAPPAEPEQPQ